MGLAVGVLKGTRDCGAGGSSLTGDGGAGCLSPFQLGDVGQAALVSYLKLAVDDKTHPEIMFNESRIYLAEQEIKLFYPKQQKKIIEKIKITQNLKQVNQVVKKTNKSECLLVYKQNLLNDYWPTAANQKELDTSNKDEIQKADTNNT